MSMNHQDIINTVFVGHLKLTTYDTANQFKDVWTSAQTESNFFVYDDDDVKRVWDSLRGNPYLLRFIMMLGSKLHYALSTNGWDLLVEELIQAHGWMKRDDNTQFLSISDEVYNEQVGGTEWLVERVKADPWFVIILLLPFIPPQVFRFVTPNQDADVSE